jgi:hypothetical protein
MLAMNENRTFGGSEMTKLLLLGLFMAALPITVAGFLALIRQAEDGWALEELIGRGDE